MYLFHFFINLKKLCISVKNIYSKNKKKKQNGKK